MIKKPSLFSEGLSQSTPGIICPVVRYVPTAMTKPSIARRALRISASGVKPNFIIVLLKMYQIVY